MDDKLLILRAFSTLNQVRDAKVPELSLLPSFHELIEDLRARLSAPEPEPVWVEVTTNTGDKFILDSAVEADKIRAAKNVGLSVVPLYTAPPQREWQGLTDEEYEAMAEQHVTNCYFDTLKYARAIEAKLKEKNSGG